MSTQKIHISIILPSLIAGGAERVMLFIAKNLDTQYFETTLVVIGYEKDKAFDTSSLKVHYLNCSRVLYGIPKLFSYLLNNKVDIVLSCMAHLNTTMALILLCYPKIKLVVREANIKKITSLYHPSKNRLLTPLLQRITEKRSAVIICQSQDMAEELALLNPRQISKIKIINNPITDAFVLKSEIKNATLSRFITVGRLHKEKGHERVLQVLAKVTKPFHYTIIGVGDNKLQIETQIRALGLNSKVSLLDYSSNIPKQLSDSDLFLQGSYAEGFPNALLESCAVGTPAVVFEAPGGTCEIIENGVNGFIAVDETSFLDYLNTLQYESLPSAMVRESVLRKFNKERIVREYETVFKTLVHAN